VRQVMASRGRRGTQAWEDEQRCEDRGSGPAPVSQEHGHGGPSIMERFKRMALPSFKGESQPLLEES
ncbi:hypothetical protein Taro_013721, partial [Colocasia esculenta]|nr:hypothetical protein [Colocasia esculenta]